MNFVRELAHLRAKYPILRRSRFLTGTHDSQLDIRDVVWVNPNGNEMTSADRERGWLKCFGAVLDGRARKTAIPRHGEDDSVLIILNSYEGEVDFRLPRTSAGPCWSLLLDTNVADGASGARFDFDGIYQVPGRSFLVFVAGEL